MSTITAPNPTELTDAKVVEGSNGLLLEIDGQIVPNYDATIHPFTEGDVVTGHVVRIDNDEVLVDIGYKSEGVIPVNELSIRKSVDPGDEVTLGEEVDALVLTKEDQDGRLISSRSVLASEKAWRCIEAAAQSGEPVEGSVIEVVKGGLDGRPRRARLPARVAGRHPPRPESRRVHGHPDRVQGHRASTARATTWCCRAPRRARGAAWRGPRAILDRLQPGQVVEGLISNIVDFGAFVDLDDRRPDPHLRPRGRMSTTRQRSSISATPSR